MKKIVAAEINHHNTPVSIRESVALDHKEIPKVLQSLSREVDEVFILATCNRLAVYGLCDDIAPIKGYFSQFEGVDSYLSEFPETADAVNHLFSTASGLESQALGEHQILGQIRTGFNQARDAATIGPVFNELLRKAIRVGKRVRGETGIGKFPTSLASVALQVINQHIEDFSGKHVLLLGTGEMAGLTARLLAKSDFASISVASQSPERAEEFAEKYNLRTERYENLPDKLNRYSVVIGATASTIPVLGPDHLQGYHFEHDLLLIDLGIPRNFSGELKEWPSINLFDLDDIKDRTKKGLQKRKQEVPKAQEIIEEEWEKFDFWLNAREVTPLIADLYDQLEDIKEEEFQWALNKLKEPDANHDRILQRLLHRMVRKFVKNPVDQIKDYAQKSDQLQQPAKTFREVFDLKQSRFHIPRKRIIIGSRGSQLALVQANNVINLMQRFAPDYEYEVKPIKTSGDSGDMVPIGAFCKEIDDALVHKKIDLAVHCLKDMPTQLPEGLQIGALLERDDHRDALLSREGHKLDELPQGGIVGTSSLRRSIQIQAARPDLMIKPLRGNLNTRMRKMREGQYDAIILGAAGLQRMDMLNEVSQLLPVDVMVPCVGQGAIALEIRELDVYLADLLKVMEHRRTFMSVMAEREYLMALGGGCNMPIGAYAYIENETLYMQGMLGTDDGSIIKYEQMKGPESQYKQMGQDMAKRLTSELEMHSAS